MNQIFCRMFIRCMVAGINNICLQIQKRDWVEVRKGELRTKTYKEKKTYKRSYNHDKMHLKAIFAIFAIFAFTLLKVFIQQLRIRSKLEKRNKKR